MICGTATRDQRDTHAITNPVVIVEVLSPTAADYDRGGRFAHYRTIASFASTSSWTSTGGAWSTMRASRRGSG